MIGQNVRNVLALFPTPTAGGVNNNFVAQGSGPFDQKSFDVRIDYSAPHNYAVFGRFSLDYFRCPVRGDSEPSAASGLVPAV